MPSSHLILYCPLLLPPIPPSIRVFSNESTLRMRCPKYWSFSFNIIPSKESHGWSSEWTGWIFLQSKGLSRVFSNTTYIPTQFKTLLPKILMQYKENLFRNNKNHLKSRKASLWSSGCPIPRKVDIKTGVQQTQCHGTVGRRCTWKTNLSLNSNFARGGSFASPLRFSPFITWLLLGSSEVT